MPDLGDPDEFVLRIDNVGVTHMVWTGGSYLRTVCASWNNTITGYNVLWAAKEVPAFPTCVYCIGYTARERRIRAELDGLAGIGVT